MAEKADAMMKPMITAMTSVQNRLRYGSTSVKGAAPRIEKRMTYFRAEYSVAEEPSEQSPYGQCRKKSE